jgi:hypothetical protein
LGQIICIFIELNLFAAVLFIKGYIQIYRNMPTSGIRVNTLKQDASYGPDICARIAEDLPQEISRGPIRHGAEAGTGQACV